ncbi:MAG: PEP-CTERM sorting domain-containing protein, partial [Planctomycetota bacterium]
TMNLNGNRRRVSILLGALFSATLFACSIFPLSNAHGEDLRAIWDNGGGDLEFSNPLNWANLDPSGLANHTLPGAWLDTGDDPVHPNDDANDTTNAIIQNGNNVLLSSNFNAANQFDILIVRFGSSLDIQADLNTNNSPILLGQIAGNTDSITQSSGAVTASALTLGDASSTYTISDGSLSLSGGLTLNNVDGSTFSLSGDTADVGAGNFTLNGASTLDLAFGATGINAIDVGNTFSISGSAILDIDGSAYSGGPATIDLVTFANLSGAFADPANINVTGFSAPTSIGYDGDSMFLIVGVPEPSSLMVLGLAGFAMGCRRRR